MDDGTQLPKNSFPVSVLAAETELHVPYLYLHKHVMSSFGELEFSYLRGSSSSSNFECVLPDGFIYKFNT